MNERLGGQKKSPWAVLAASQSVKPGRKRKSGPGVPRSATREERLLLCRRHLRHGFEVDVYRRAQRRFHFAERGSEYGNIQVDADCFPRAIATVCIASKSQVHTSTRWRWPFRIGGGVSMEGPYQLVAWAATSDSGTAPWPAIGRLRNRLAVPTASTCSTVGPNAPAGTAPRTRCNAPSPAG